MRQFKSLHLAMLLFSSSCLNFAYATTSTLKSMTDSELSEAAGQALLSMSYISPTDLANKEAQRIGGDNSIGFYKLGLEAEMELNVNIKSLQLGCGGVNGAGGCDIDIDYISLSGLGNSATSNTDSAADRAARVGSSAVLSNPFIEFAIKNPDKASTRQVVGLNLSAEKALGLVTFKENFNGYEDSDGCPDINLRDIDTDGDGINDADDQCRTSPETRNGYKDSDGCPDVCFTNPFTGRQECTG